MEPDIMIGPPTRGELLCEIILKPEADRITDLCWTPQEELLVARYKAGQVMKIEFDREKLSVTHKDNLYTGQGFSSVTCDDEGSWGVVGHDIQLHWPEAPIGQVRRLSEVPDARHLLMYKNEIWVSSWKKGPIHVYGRDHNPRGSYHVNGNKHKLAYLTASHDRLIATTGGDGNYLHILNLSDWSLATVGGEGEEDGKFCWPEGVTTDSNGYILVCDMRNDRVSVFSPSGDFLHQLTLCEGAKTSTMKSPYSIALRTRVDQPPLMALGSACSGIIWIYELHSSNNLFREE